MKPSLRGVVSLALPATLVGCSSLPWTDYGQPSAKCADIFVPAGRLEWAGRGDPVELGFREPREGFENAPRAEGYAFVGQVNPEVEGPEWSSGRAFCIEQPDGAIAGPLPEGWEPP